jgi:hypothetical protein
MYLPRRHPRPDELSDFLAASAPESRARVAAHLQRCQDCRDSLQLLRGATAAAREMPVSGPSPELRSRIFASRASDTRMIGIAADVPERSRPRWRLPLAAATLIVLVGGMVLTQHASRVEAGTTSGTLVFTPSAPRAGQAVAVSYSPAGMLSGQPWVALRARTRGSVGDSYNVGLATSTIATLRRGADGSFTGRFVLPDSVVYAAFAVNDSSGSVVDDNAGRDWELLASDSTGKPLFGALDQRANDMMGRNWEEGLATAQRMIALYPRDLRAWVWMHSFDGWLGRTGDDSVRARHRATLAEFDSTFNSGTTPSADQIGLMAWYADGIDSTNAKRWRARLMRDAPQNSFAVQWRLVALMDTLRTRTDTAKTLHQLDALWNSAPVHRQAQIAAYATSVALATADTSLIELWTARLVRADPDPRSTSRWVATRLSSVPALRAEGIRRMRAELDSLTALPQSERALNETVAEQRKRHAATARELLASLGQALVAAGDYPAARDALARAASSGWNPDVFRDVRTASLAVGDTARALTMAARIAVDPRTSAAFGDSVRPLAERKLGAAGWRSQLDSARSEYVKRMLADASSRALAGSARVHGLDGRVRTLGDLTNGRLTVIAFWSRFCGPAVEDLPRLNAAAARLARDGVPLVTIVDETTASPALRAFLAEKHVTAPTYLDAHGESSRALNEWGTPSYYVVDSDGRIRFDATNSADEALARAEALRLSETRR